MNEAVEALKLDLESDDPRKRSSAAGFAGNYGADAMSLLPQLLEMVSQNLVPDSAGTRFGEFVSVGRILRSIEELRNQELASDEMVRLSDHCVSTILSLLDSAAGARASLLIYVLVLIGPRTAHTASVVSRIATRSVDQRIKYRAYQFACSVCPELASQPPWSDFAPADADERVKWGAL